MGLGLKTMLKEHYLYPLPELALLWLDLHYELLQKHNDQIFLTEDRYLRLLDKHSAIEAL